VAGLFSLFLFVGRRRAVVPGGEWQPTYGSGLRCRVSDMMFTILLLCLCGILYFFDPDFNKFISGNCSSSIPAPPSDWDSRW
jgi:hypothetical protein